MKKTAFIIGVLWFAGLLAAQQKVDVAKISAAATGAQTAVNSDSVVCSTDAGCAAKIADGADVTLGSKADAKSTATDTTSITAMQVLKQISASVQAPPSQAVTNAGTFATQVSQWGGTNVVTGGVNGSVGVGGLAASGSATAGNPVLVGALSGGNAASLVMTTSGSGLKVDASGYTTPVSGTVAGSGTFQVGGNASGSTASFLRCDNSVVYDTNTNGKTQLVALSSGKVTYVCGVSITQSTTTAVTVSLGSGTGTNCGSTYTAKTPAWPIQAPTSVSPSGVVLNLATAPWFQTAASEELCISTSAGVSVQLLVSYTQF